MIMIIIIIIIIIVIIIDLTLGDPEAYTVGEEI